MGMTDIRDPGRRREIAGDRRRTGGDAGAEPPVRESVPTPEAAETLGRRHSEPVEERPVEGANVDTSLRERIRRLSAARAEALRSRDEPPRRADPEERGEEPVMRPVASRDAERDSDDFSSRQPARRRRAESERDAEREFRAPVRRRRAEAESEPEREFRAPARRRAAPPDYAATRVDPLDDEVADLREEVLRLRQEVRELRKEVQDRPSGASEIGPVERAVQKLAERMDRIDGGPRPPVADARPKRPGRGFLGLFGRN